MSTALADVACVFAAVSVGAPEALSAGPEVPWDAKAKGVPAAIGEGVSLVPRDTGAMVGAAWEFESGLPEAVLGA